MDRQRATRRVLGCVTLLWMMSALAGHSLAQPASQPRASLPLADLPAISLPQPAEASSLDAAAPEVRDLYERARQQLDEGRAQEALATLDAALSSGQGNHYEIAYLLAMAHLRVGQLGQARLAAEQATRLRPGEADAHFLLGALYVGQSQPEAALEQFRIVTGAPNVDSGNPRVTAAWYRLGQAFEKQGYLRAAAEAYARFDEAVFETHPEHANADEVRTILQDQPSGTIAQQVELWNRLGDPAGAVKAAQGAVSQRPDETWVRALLLKSMLKAGQADAAFTAALDGLQGSDGGALRGPALEAALAANRLQDLIAKVAESGDAGQMRSLAERLMAMQRYSDAEALLKTPAAAGDAHAIWLAAACERARGDLAAALKRLVALLGNQPNAVLMAGLESWMSAASDDIDELRRLATEPLQQTLCAAAAASADAAWARDALQSAAAAKGTHAPLAKAILAKVYLDTYDWAEAQRWADATLAASDAACLGHYVRAAALSALDQTEDAESAFKAAIRCNSREPAFVLGLARHYARSETGASSQRYYLELLELDPSSEEAVEELITSYLADGKLAIAREQARAALELDLSDDAQRRIQTQVRFAERRYSPEHVSELERQHAEHPDDLASALRLVEGLLELRRRSEARDLADRLLHKWPQDERVLHAHAAVHIADLDFEAAIQSLEALTARYPRRVQLLWHLARAQLADFRKADLEATLARLMGLTDDEGVLTDARQMLLRAHTAFGDFDKALALIDEWSKSSDLVGLKVLRFRALEEAGRAADALAEAESALKQAPADPALRSLYLSAAMAAKAYDDAEARVREWLSDSPQDAALAHQLVEVLLESGKAEAALQAVDGLPTDTWESQITVRDLRARCLAARGEIDEAIAELDSLLSERMVQSNPELRRRLRQRQLLVLVEGKRPEEALERAQKWAESVPARDLTARVEALEHRRLAAQAAGRTDVYTRTLEELLQFAPDDPGLNNDLGYSWVDSNQHLEQATEMIRRAVIADPLNAAFLDSLGWACYKAGDFESARKYLARATTLHDGLEPVSADHLADAEYRLGNAQEAVKLWEKSLELASQDENTMIATDRQQLREQVTAKIQAVRAQQSAAVAPTAAEAGDPSTRPVTP